jgi:hypothetical protein
MFALDGRLLTVVILTEEAKLTLQFVGIQGFQKALADGLAVLLPATAHLVPWTAQPRHSCTPCGAPDGRHRCRAALANSRHLPAVTNYRNILWTMAWPFWARRRLRGLRLVATDADWSAGAGKELRGPSG